MARKMSRLSLSLALRRRNTEHEEVGQLVPLANNPVIPFPSGEAGFFSNSLVHGKSSSTSSRGLHVLRVIQKARRSLSPRSLFAP